MGARVRAGVGMRTSPGEGRRVGAAARLSTRQHIRLERCDWGAALGDDRFHSGIRHVLLPHPARVACAVILEDLVAILRI